MPLLKLFSACAGKKSSKQRAEQYIVPRQHESCRSNDPRNLKRYEKSRGGKEAAKSAEENFIERPYISDENVPWTQSWPDYVPIEFTSEKILSGKYDPQDTKLIKTWNDVDGKIDRRSHHGEYKLTEELRPVNPKGRTGLSGRGHLGRWGPNHAADPIVTRWKKDDKGKNVKVDGKKVLQFVAIERKDTKDWAIPGGMVDPGEKITETLKREFMEEATNSTQMTPKDKEEVTKQLEELFSVKKAKMIYQGYVDDPRNTDNAWMETAAYNFHDDSDLFDRVKLHAGDDAKGVQWMDIDRNVKLYASHKEFIEKTAQLLKAHW